jgi:diguanylate cyclase (GGDEF)-like protein/PAS domain S-box-containing protein
MMTTLNVLLVEDSEDDAILVTSALRAGGVDANIERVETGAALDAALLRGQWDAVISDFDLPGFTGRAALACVKAHDSDLPFLLVSGTVGEATAVDMMRAGAHDYIMKGELSRLAPALERELREAEERRGRRRADERYRMLVEELPVAAYTGSGATPMTYVSPEIETMLGYSREEWMSNPDMYYAILHPDDHDRVVAAYDLSVETNTRFESEHRMIAADGRIVWIRDVSVIVKQPDSETPSEHGVMIDITVRKEAESHLVFQSRLLDTVGQSVITTTLDGEITFWNRGAERLFLFPREAVIGSNIVDVLRSELSMENSRALVRARESGEEHVDEMRVLRRDGTTVPILTHTTPMYGDAGDLTGIIGVSSDITERKNAEEILLHSESRYRSLVEASPDGVVLIDGDGKVLMANAQLSTMLGYSSSSAMTGTRFMEHLLDDAQLRAPRVWHHRATGLDAGTPATEYTVVRRDGSSFPAEVYSSIVQDGEAHASITTATIHDVTERMAYEAQLQHLALHDAMTGLPNRTLLQDRLRQALSAAKRTGDSLAVLVLDLDRLQGINDTYGHSVGDQVLREVGTRLAGSLRESDTLARLAGDEFAVLLPEADLFGALQTVTKLSETLETTIDVGDNRLHMGVTAGIALFPDHAEDGDRLLRFADIAMYDAKEANSGYAVYAIDRDPFSPTRLALSGDLREAIKAGELVLHYQPKMRLDSGNIDGLEALVRWNHPEHGLIAPDSFIPLAEHSGLIQPLTLWVIERAMIQCGEWRRMGFGVGISVNLSARSLYDPELTPFIVEHLQTTGVPADQFTVEITESVIMVDPERALKTLTRLNEIGVKLSVDDFGTGYSSLAYLQQLRAHEVKIDKSFVMELNKKPENEFIVRSVIDLGHNLGLDVVAEGVENQITQDALAVFACDHVQGYFLCRPMSADAMTVWLQSRKALENRKAIA